MALQLRGNTQIREASVSLSKIADVSSKTILGRHETTEGYGVMKALSPLEARQVLELDSAADAVFSSSSAGTITAGSSLISQGSLSVTGTTTLSGKLTANGTGNTLADAEITNDLTVGGSATLQSGATVTGETETDTLTVNQTSTFSQDVTMSADLTVSGTSTLSDAVVSGKIEHTGSTSAEKFTSSNVEITGGTIDGTDIGQSVAAAGKFTTLEATGDLTVSGNLTVSGSLTSIETTSMSVKDPLIVLGKDNTSDSDDVGFVAGYNLDSAGDGNYAGLVRDANDSGKFKLFSTSENLSSTNQVDFSLSSKGTLVADIEGNIQFDSAIDIILEGDVTGSASFSGNNNVTITTTIDNLMVQYDDIDFLSTDTSLGGASASDQEVPSQLAVKTYIDNQISTGGQSSANLEAMDMLMSDGTEFLVVKEAYEMRTVSLSDLDSALDSIDNIELDANSDEVNSTFEALSNVYLNGQKLRYGADANASDADYYFDNNDSSERKKLVLLGSQVLNLNDELEIRYFVES